MLALLGLLVGCSPGPCPPGQHAEPVYRPVETPTGEVRMQLTLECRGDTP
jgi:hypothetical protein